MEFQKLLKIEFERKGLKTVQQMADFSGINTEYLRQALHGKRILSDDIIVEACDKMKLSTEKTRELLLAAAKDRAKEPKTKDAWSHIFNSPASGTPFELPPTDYYTVPVWSSVQAGTGHLSEQTAEVVDEVLLATEEYKAKCFAIQIKGDSMEPEIKDGDIGIFEPPNGLQPAENDVVIVELEGHGQWMVKRLKINGPSRIELISSNQDNPPIRVSLDTEKIEIKGILLRTVRKFKKRLFLK
jgi:phage repressor protein C with HTH and peptisase S24 domain